MTRACSASSARRSPSSCTRLSCTWERTDWRSLRTAASSSCELTSWFFAWRELVALGEDRVRRVLDPLLELGQELLLLLRLLLEDADALDDRLVLLGHALEELRPLEQVGEAVGRQDHGERVGLVSLVQLDQAGGERLLGDAELLAQPLEPLARLLELAAHLEQLGALLVERSPGRGSACAGGR